MRLQIWRDEWNEIRQSTFGWRHRWHRLQLAIILLILLWLSHSHCDIGTTLAAKFISRYLHVCRFTLCMRGTANCGFSSLLQIIKARKNTRAHCTTTDNDTILRIDEHGRETRKFSRQKKATSHKKHGRHHVRRDLSTRISSAWNRMCSLVVTLGLFRPKRLHH